MNNLDKHREIGKCISILQRLNNMFYANRLSSFQIGCGQQFFLLQVFKNPGMNLHDMALNGHYDKATATRAVKKLEEEGYVRTETEEEDKRVRRIYLTDQAKPVVEKTVECVDEWTDIILAGFTGEERQEAEQLLIRMASNAHHFTTRHRGKE
ncbi:MarR family transcriptional regulator [Clostridium boliviensis]|uniref:MarR family transcriptional regulator n=1 Tax=Clostridium boliviensis TaxID=318465 RepID=A0ABU4GJP3_9CLOT|nr:MarR family transcriptional regulator [Clostridium boliviensis]MDW2797840.1 MarR family transcriptional regulator [Clostridium boliviensis]